MSVKSKDLKRVFDSLSPDEKSKLKGSTLLITGCAGFLGYYFMEFFRVHGGDLGVKRVVALDNFMLGTPNWISVYENDPRFELANFDIINDSLEGLDDIDEADSNRFLRTPFGLTF